MLPTPPSTSLLDAAENAANPNETVVVQTRIKRAMPVDVRDVKIEEPGAWYDGWMFSARVNPGASVIGAVLSSSVDRIIWGLQQVIKEWDYVDENGEPLPLPEGVGMLPADLMAATIKAWDTAGGIPKAKKI